MASRAGRKRSANPQSESSNNYKSKKMRFVDPEEDPADFEEQVEASLEKRMRRGRLKTDGYESDSTNDGEGVVNSRRGVGEGAEELEDMFAGADDDGGAIQGSSKKQEKYMRLGDIEGQEFGADRSDEGDEESGDENEPEDEDDAERRKKAGMGYELSSFNMRDEMDEGKFTEDGSYIRTFDPNVVHDRWMDGVGERDIKLARQRKRESEKKRKAQLLADEQALQASGGKGSIERDLLPFLKKGESVLEALQRSGSQSKKSHKSRSSNVEAITHLASMIMSLGDTDIYDRTYEELVRSVRSSGIVKQDWVPPSAEYKYEYKWRSSESAQPDAVFGPFSEDELKSWYLAFYFGPSGEKIQVRRVGGDWGEWDDVVQ